MNQHKGKAEYKKSRYTISEFAKLTNVTPETLRHYHRIGILAPSVTDPRTGYRYYSLLEVETLGVIRTLQSMDMPLKTIKYYLENKSIFSSYRLLSQQLEYVDRKLQELSTAQSFLQNKLDSIRSILDEPQSYRIQIRTIEERIGYSTNIPCNTYKEYQSETAKILEHYHKNLFISNSFATFISEGELLSESPSFYSIVLGITKPEETSVRQVQFPGGLYATLQFNGTFLDSHPHFLHISSWLKTHNYTVSGNPILVCIIDESITSLPTEFVTEIQVPVLSEK